MMKEQVCITPVMITKAGQVKHFQIKLPKTAKKIIGIEIGGQYLKQDKIKIAPTGATVVATASNTNQVTAQQNANGIKRTPFKRNVLIGDLKLQSCEEANIFYAGEFRVDSNITYGDFSANRFWQPEIFTHQMQTFEEVVITNADTTILLGMYKDNLGIQYDGNYNYQVNVYVWYSL